MIVDLKVSAYAGLALMRAAAVMRRSAEHTDTPTNPQIRTVPFSEDTDYYIIHSRGISLCV